MACMQLPRNVSPVSASFIGLQRQGIHPVLCRACRLDAGCLVGVGSRAGLPQPRAPTWRHDHGSILVCHPLLRFAARLLGKIEVIMFLQLVRCFVCAPCLCGADVICHTFRGLSILFFREFKGIPKSPVSPRRTPEIIQRGLCRPGGTTLFGLTVKLDVS